MTFSIGCVVHLPFHYLRYGTRDHTVLAVATRAPTDGVSHACLSSVSLFCGRTITLSLCQFVTVIELADDVLRERQITYPWFTEFAKYREINKQTCHFILTFKR